MRNLIPFLILAFIAFGIKAQQPIPTTIECFHGISGSPWAGTFDIVDGISSGKTVIAEIITGNFTDSALVLHYDDYCNLLWSIAFDSIRRTTRDITTDGSYYYLSYADLFFETHVVKIDSNGNIVWNRIIAGNGQEYSYQIQIDTSRKRLYVFGNSTSDDIHLNRGAEDLWLAYLDLVTGSLIRSSTYGGSLNEYQEDISVDPITGKIALSGTTSSVDGDFVGCSGGCFFILEIDTSGYIVSKVTWSTLNTLHASHDILYRESIYLIHQSLDLLTFQSVFDLIKIDSGLVTVTDTLQASVYPFVLAEYAGCLYMTGMNGTPLQSLIIEILDWNTLQRLDSVEVPTPFDQVWAEDIYVEPSGIIFLTGTYVLGSNSYAMIIKLSFDLLLPIDTIVLKGRCENGTITLDVHSSKRSEYQIWKFDNTTTDWSYFGSIVDSYVFYSSSSEAEYFKLVSDGVDISDIIAVEACGSDNVNIFPNPAHNVLNITGVEGEAFEIYTIFGTAIMKGYTSSGISEIDISALPVGHYLLKIGNSDVKVRKFIKDY